MLKLYHFSNKNLDIIKPEFFGHNNYTLNDIKAGKIERAFYFTTSEAPEKRFNSCLYCYTIEIEPESIYNLIEDTNFLKFKYRDIEKLLYYLREHYKGAIYNVGNYDVVILFEDMKSINKTIRR